MNTVPSEIFAIGGVIDPDIYAVATYTTDWVDCGLYYAIAGTVYAGSIGVSGTLDAKLEQATDASGTGVKDVPNSSITQLTRAGGDSDSQVIVELLMQDMDIRNNFSHVRLSITVAVASSDISGTVVGFYARGKPAFDTGIASVIEIITAG